eukprot:6413137-Amphidinium_carterae.1
MARLMRLLLGAGLEMPDVEFLFNVRDRPSSPLHSMNPVFTSWTTSSHSDIPFPDPRRVAEAADGCLATNGGGEQPLLPERIPKLFFRGSLSGGTTEEQMMPDNFATFPRSRLMLLSETRPELFDVGITPGNPEHGISEGALGDPALREFMQRHRKPYVPQTNWSKYAYQVVLDGVSGASRLACTLLSGSVVLKQTSPYYSWFERWLEPYVHMVPIAYDLSDLLRRLEVAQERPAHMARITEEARHLMQRVFTLPAMMCYLARLLISYSAMVGYTPGAPSIADGWLPLDESAQASKAKTTAEVNSSDESLRDALPARADPRCNMLMKHGETRKGLACYTDRHAAVRSPLASRSGDFETSWLKLAHDTEMFLHLGVEQLPSQLREVPALFSQVLANVDTLQSRPSKMVKVVLRDAAQTELWSAAHNRDVFKPQVAR